MTQTGFIISKKKQCKVILSHRYGVVPHKELSISYVQKIVYQEMVVFLKILCILLHVNPAKIQLSKYKNNVIEIKNKPESEIDLNRRAPDIMTFSYEETCFTIREINQCFKQQTFYNLSRR